jgi:hypothetical protein
MGIISTIKNNWKPYTIGFTLVLLLTNPSHEDFTNRLSVILGSPSNLLLHSDATTVSSGQELNLFICSLYKCNIISNKTGGEVEFKILGFFGNFIVVYEQWD